MAAFRIVGKCPRKGSHKPKVFYGLRYPIRGGARGQDYLVDFMRTITRIDQSGRDVTELAGLWDESDLEILSTPFSDPEQTSGQKTNGPALFFIRRLGGAWIYTDFKSRNALQTAISNLGVVFFEGLNYRTTLLENRHR